MMLALFITSAQAEEYQLTAQSPDAQAKKAISALIKLDLLEPEKRYDGTIVPYHALWLTLSESEPPYLFVMHECLTIAHRSACQIRGFRKGAHGWSKIFSDFGGRNIKVLDTKTNGHADLMIDSEDESQGGAPSDIFKFKWADDWYGERITERISPETIE